MTASQIVFFANDRIPDRFKKNLYAGNLFFAFTFPPILFHKNISFLCFQLCLLITQIISQCIVFAN